MRHPHDTREFRRQARLASRELIRIRPIQTRDDPGMAGVIRAVMTEMKACAKGFAIHDPEVEHMSRAYADDRSRFWVVVRGDEERVVGGAGFAPLEGGPADTCELRKMYFLPEARGLGLGAELLQRALTEARRVGYAQCYLETLNSMAAARRLYEAFGFKPLNQPMGCTGHFACDSWYALALDDATETIRS